MASTDAVSRERTKLECCPPGRDGRFRALTDLAEALHDRFKKKGEIDDLNEAIALHRAALELRPLGNDNWSFSVNDFASCLSNRYDNQGELADLEEAITLRRAILELHPLGHPDRIVSLHNLACLLRRRFRKQADMCDLGESIELLRAVLQLCPPRHPHRCLFFHDLALCLVDSYDNKRVLAELEEAVTLGREALQLCPRGHPDRGVSLNNLACHIRRRFLEQAAICDLEEAIELHREALELRPSGHPDRSSSLSSLAVCLSDRYDNYGVVSDLEEAVAFGRAALKLHPPGHPDRTVSLHNLACHLRKRFLKQATICDLEEAIGLHRVALELRPSGHFHRSSSLHELALCFSNRYDCQRVAADLEEAVTLGRAALALRPAGHPDRCISFKNLARDLRKKFQNQARMPGLHGANPLHSAASEDCLTSHVDISSSLFELSLHFWDRFRTQATLADLDEAICLAAYVLELRLPGHSDYTVSLEQLTLFVGERVQRLAQQTNSDEAALLGQAVNSLCAVANYFRDRFRDQHAIVDLKEAITLYRYALRFRPTGHLSRASSLHDLAQCLADLFRQQRTPSDLEEAIMLEQEVLRLLVPGDDRYDVSRRCYKAYLKLKISLQASMTPSGVTHIDIRQTVRNVASEILKTMPTRLLHTSTGILCSRDAQISHFLSSQQSDQLLSLCATCDPAQGMELIRTDVSRYFQYVTFSHRWSEREPSMRDIEGRSIYSMSTNGALAKLQTFCLVACEREYLWAWSDTCCIDKDSSSDVQEAIVSMFAWYRRSALTIVYLSDVPDTGSFECSEWFARGWTLQELLAPQRILFYTRNWSLYRGLTSSNHKADVIVLEELERVTGIESRALTDFSPGMDDARSRFQWASLRVTSRPEDIAYSLFGIFKIYLPVLYGESAENALGRLLAEVISQSGDISVLDWIGEASAYHSCFPAHITSYQLLLSLPQRNAEDESTPMSPQVKLFKALRKLHGLLVTSPLRFLSRPLTLSSVSHRLPAVRLRTPDSYFPSNVYGFHSLTMVPLPRFINRRLILPCIAHRVSSVQREEADPLAPSYTYKIQAFGLRPLEITLPDKLEDAARLECPLQLQVVRPWHSKLLCPFTDLGAVTEEQLLSVLGRPFNALLLTQLPHNEHKRIATSTFITAQPIDRASILKSKIWIFNIV